MGAITTRDITRTAGVSDGVLYNYFSDKNDLLVAALVRRFTRIVADFDAGLPTAGAATVEANLETLTRACLRLNHDQLPLLAGMMGEPALLQRFLETIHGLPAGPSVVPRRIAEYLAAEADLGRLPPVDPEAATTLITGATAVLALSGLLSGASVDGLAGQLPAVVAMLTDGLRGRSPD